MKQYAGDYSKYMSQGSGDSSSPAATLLVRKDAKGTDGATDATQASSDSSAGGYGNYMKQYAGSYMGGGSAGGYGNYMKQYAGSDMGQEGSDSSAGGAGNYMKQYAGDYSKYMSQGSGDSSSPAATLLVQKDAKDTDGAATDATQASS